MLGYRADEIIGQPITYKGPDGKQYVAVLSGVGGWAGAIVSGGKGTAAGKIEALQAAGIAIAETPAAIADTLISRMNGSA